MTKKLQVFISSTYVDLIVERQAAVEAVLRAGHIPAGMELFAAGNKSQLDTIRRWIDESDVFMLVLGGRYGSIEPGSKKSYTQLEYEHAVNSDKPFFAVVLSDSAIDVKARSAGASVIEKDHPDLLRSFRSLVLSRVCRMVDDAKDIKVAVHETLMDFLRQYDFSGWVSGQDVSDSQELARELNDALRELERLRVQIAKMEVAAPKIVGASAPSKTNKLRTILSKTSVVYVSEGVETKWTLLSWFYSHMDALVRGVTNRYGAKGIEVFLYHQIAPKLAIHGLMELEKVAGAQWTRFKTTKAGNALLAELASDRALAKDPGAESADSERRESEGKTEVAGSEPSED